MVLERHGCSRAVCYYIPRIVKNFFGKRHLPQSLDFANCKFRGRYVQHALWRHQRQRCSAVSNCIATTAIGKANAGHHFDLMDQKFI